MLEGPRVFVAGHPVGHSRSPLIHRSWLAKYGLRGHYEAVDVEADEFAALLAAVRTGDWTGGNVTVPHKEAAFALVDRHDAAAAAIGAVNTLYMEDGLLVGANTDAHGFAANLDQRLTGWRDGEAALVLGAGGASRAVVHALLDAGYRRVYVVNRTAGRAEALAERFGAAVKPSGWDNAGALVAAADIIVNTTSLGMAGQPALSMDLSRARAGTLATDIVYVPLETPFLRAASAAGLTTCDGLGMLLHQAAPGFARWFGRWPDVDEALRESVIADLQGTHAA